MKHRTLMGALLCVAMFLSLAPTAYAEPGSVFASGNGTEENPWCILTAEQLGAFAAAVDGGETYVEQYVALGADVDLSGIANWNPIGGEAVGAENIFQGNFDGAGHTIRNLAIQGSYSEESNLGLFSRLGATAVVRDLTLAMVSINAGNAEESSVRLRAGALAGDTESKNPRGTVVSGVSVTGAITVATNGIMGMAGGILGRMSGGGVLANCTADVTVTSTASGDTGFWGYAGGLAAMTGNNCLIVNAAAYGTVSGSALQGGAAGMLTGSIYNVYTNVNLTGAAEKSGHVAGQTMASGNWAYFAGTGEAFGTVTMGEVTSEVRDETGEALATLLNGNLQGLSKVLDEDALALREWTAESEDGKVLPNGAEWRNVEPDSTVFDGGAGTEADPWRIATAEQLRAFAADQTKGADYSGYYVCLSEDIDISGETWSPIGGIAYAFSGVFDGADHSISGMTIGTAEAPQALDSEHYVIGLFSFLNDSAEVRNLSLRGVSVYVTSEASAYVGGLVGYMAGSREDQSGAWIDSVNVSGTISLTGEKGNAWAAGIAGYQYYGAITNSRTDVSISCVVQSGNAIAEAGGLVALNNRGLVANCYTLGSVYGSASRDNGDEGMAAVSGLVGVNGGNLVGCYSRGGHRTGQLSYYTGAVSGWVTGIGKSYSCWYNGEAEMMIGQQAVVPVESIGTKVPAGVSEDGELYIGGVVDDNNPFTADTYSEIANGLNEKFAAYPIDIVNLYGLSAGVLKTWTYDAAAGLVGFADTYGNVSYQQPEAEIVPAVEYVLRDGVWYGRDETKTTVVEITVTEGEITQTKALSGETEGDAYTEALETAKEKAVYGDTSGYGAPDYTVFAGGTGTESDPYQITTVPQLRYLAEALSEDNSWEGLWFRQMADLTLDDGEWLPIGWGIYTEIKGSGTQYCVYPFAGNYDGNGFAIRNLRIGTVDTSTDDVRAQYFSGLFGIVAGELPGNVTFAEGEYRLVHLENIVLENLAVNVSSRYANYVAGLAGVAQNGFIIRNCSVHGTVTSYSRDSFARGGGISANAMRGLVTNSWTDTVVSVATDAGDSYGGGLYAMDNRTTTLNCYALGNVTGDATNTNKVHLGGLTGQCGGAHYNCYAAGDVTSEKVTTDAGILNGRLAGIAVEIDCYYNADAKLNGAAAKATGVDVTENEVRNQTYAKTAEELKSAEFADLLNGNRKNTGEKIAEIRELTAGGDLVHPIYYTGDGSDLSVWTVKTDRVGFVPELTAEADDTGLSYRILQAEGLDATLAAAAYDAAGKMLSCVWDTSPNRQGKISLDSAATYRIFLLDTKTCAPLCAKWEGKSKE